MADQHEAFHELAIVSTNLLINVGIMNAASESWPDEIQANWTREIEEIERILSRKISEVQEFASSFD